MRVIITIHWNGKTAMQSVRLDTITSIQSENKKLLFLSFVALIFSIGSGAGARRSGVGRCGQIEPLFCFVC